MESLVKAIAIGLVIDENSYLRENWNILDFFIVISSLIDLIFSGVNVPVIKILRLLRTLRPLRFISHNNSMKTVVIALLESVGHIFNVVVVVIIVWLMFAILGVSLFGGKLNYCSKNKYSFRTKEQCEINQGVWMKADSNFDNVPAAMMTLFVVSSFEGWPEIMYSCIDGDREGFGPVKDVTPMAAYYFVSFILIGSFFFLNFFIGVLFLNFKAAQKTEKQQNSEAEMHWQDMLKMILSATPDFEFINVPKGKLRLKIHNFVTKPYFDVGIMICIVLNMI